MKCPVFRIFPAGTDCPSPDGTRWKHGRWKMPGKSACRRSSGANSLTGKGKSGLRTDLSTENGDKYDDVRRKGEGRPAPERCVGGRDRGLFPNRFSGPGFCPYAQKVHCTLPKPPTEVPFPEEIPEASAESGEVPSGERNDMPADAGMDERAAKRTSVVKSPPVISVNRVVMSPACFSNSG